MNVVWTQKAENDLKEIIKYISFDSIKNAEAIYGKIKKSIKQLEDFPESGMLSKDQTLINRGYRMLIVEKYLIFYLYEKQVIIIRIIHGAQRYSHLITEKI